MPTQAKPPHARPRLGRGLSTLISTSTEPTSADDQTYKHVTGLPPLPPPAQPTPQPSTRPEEIKITDIAPNPYQPRRQFNEDELSDLTASIAAQGILQPLMVAPTSGAELPFVLIAGERRLRAAKSAGL